MIVKKGQDDQLRCDIVKLKSLLQTHQVTIQEKTKQLERLGQEVEQVRADRDQLRLAAREPMDRLVTVVVNGLIAENEYNRANFERASAQVKQISAQLEQARAYQREMEEAIIFHSSTNIELLKEVLNIRK